mmetsp:Transcript_99031/g.308615  ORF Transcript_99031/g.308615 Transcript_99031/m.308615 type:complete len:350 (+) Transcript_99031:191-1240(+)
MSTLRCPLPTRRPSTAEGSGHAKRVAAGPKRGALGLQSVGRELRHLDVPTGHLGVLTGLVDLRGGAGALPRRPILVRNEALGRFAGHAEPLHPLHVEHLGRQLPAQRLLPPLDLCLRLPPGLHGCLEGLSCVRELDAGRHLLLLLLLAECEEAQDLRCHGLALGHRGLELLREAADPVLEDSRRGSHGQLVELLAAGRPGGERLRKGRDEGRLGVQALQKLGHGLEGGVAGLVVLPTAVAQHAELPLEKEGDFGPLGLQRLPALHNPVLDGVRLLLLQIGLRQGRAAPLELLRLILDRRGRRPLGLLGRRNGGDALFDLIARSVDRALDLGTEALVLELQALQRGEQQL